MAEKQYKNYDERFLKEESSGSRPILTYPEGIEAEDILVIVNSEPNSTVYLVLPKEDGSYCQTSDDLKDLFIKGFILDGYDMMFTPSIFVKKVASNFDFPGIELASDLNSVYIAVTEPSFNQIKQSQILTS